MLQTKCSVCGASIQFPVDWLGKRFHCPQCGNSPLIFSDAGLLTHLSSTDMPAAPASPPAQPEPKPKEHGGVTLLTALAPLVIVGLAWLLTGNAGEYLAVVVLYGFGIGFGGCLMGGLLASYKLGGLPGNGFKGGMLAAFLMLLAVAPALFRSGNDWAPALFVFIFVPGTFALALVSGLGGTLGVMIGRSLSGTSPRPSSHAAPSHFVNEQ